MRDHTPGQRRRTLSVIAASAVATIALVGAGSLPAIAADNVAIDIYTMNDFHGRLEASSSTAGAASIATAYKQFHAANPNSSLVSAGDNVGASTFTSLVQKDQPTIDALNEIGLSVSAVGNHELDYGRDDLDDRIIQHDGVPNAQWEFTSANLFNKGTDVHAYAPYSIQSFDGVRVAFVGATTEDLPTLVSPAGITTIDVRPIVASVNQVAEELKDGDDTNGEADVVMVLMHEGGLPSEVDAANHSVDPSTVLGKIVYGVGARADAFITGHTHQLYSADVDIDGKSVPVLETGSYGTNLGHVALSFDKDTKSISSIHGETLPLLSGGKQIYPDDPTVAQTVADAVAVAKVQGSVSIGSITADLKRGINTSPDASGSNENRGAESTIGNLVADAQLAATQADLGTQIAFMNPGGIRQNLNYASGGEGDPDGNITYAEAATVQPFANTLVTETLTGAQIKTVLEQQWQPTSSRPTLHLGISKGLSYSYDPTAEQGAHISTVFFDGRPIADTDTFKIVTNSFLAAGGDGFTELGNGQGQADSGRIDLNAFSDYMAANSPVSPDSASRSIGVVSTTPGLEVEKKAFAKALDAQPSELSTLSADAGEQLSFELSSLDVNNAPIQDSEVVTTVDGLELARSPIDHTIVDGFDEQGRATVAFALPADLEAGDHALSFSLPETGVRLDYTLTIAAGEEPTPTPTPTPSPTPTGSGSPAPVATTPEANGQKLANTGSDTTGLAWPAAGALSALLLGAALVTVQLRRRKAARR